jgi:ribosome-binding factor A
MADFINAHPEPDKGGGRRKQRLESLLKREVATMVTQELRDPRIGFVSVTRCELSPDLSQLTAFYTVYGDETKRRLAAQALDSAAPYIQRGYAKTVRTRRLPLLRFRYDEDDVQRRELDQLIDRANAERRPDTDEAAGD